MKRTIIYTLPPSSWQGMHSVRLPRLRKAAALGDADAQYELGNYLIPDSGEISREVLKWYRPAAENGQMDAWHACHFLRHRQ